MVVAPATFGQALFDAVKTSDYRSRATDLLHAAIEVRFDEQDQRVFGVVRHTYRALRDSLDYVLLDAGPMDIYSVSIDDRRARFTHDDIEEELRVILHSSINYNDTIEIRIEYSAKPERGMYFIRPTPEQPELRRQIWTQGEAEDHHYWLPIYDSPNERCTFDVSITVDTALKALSNGDRISVSPNTGGTATWRYRMSDPITPYLLMIAVGEYAIKRDTVDGIALSYWYYGDLEERLERSLGMTPEAFRYLTKEFGMAYPWRTYAQVFLSNFMYGGMENATATTLTDRAFIDARTALDYSPSGVVAHEIAHQWFGDLVTARSWEHLWLHEGFATYYASMFNGHYWGAERFEEEMDRHLERALNYEFANGKEPIAGGKASAATLYSRGARVLHMLRFVVGDSAYNNAIRAFLTAHRYGLADTDDLKKSFEYASGRNLSMFFDQWLYKAGFPLFRVQDTYNGDDNEVTITVEQIQDKDSQTGYFTTPVYCEAVAGDKVYGSTAVLRDSITSIRIPCPIEPDYVLFDAGDRLIKLREHNRPIEQIIAQMHTARRMIDRLYAVRDLEELASPEALAALAEAVLREPHPFVRRAMTYALRATPPSADLRETFYRLARDKASSVRKEATTKLGAWQDDTTLQAIRAAVRDSSYEVYAEAIKLLANREPQEAFEWLRERMHLIGRRSSVLRAHLYAINVIGTSEALALALPYTGAHHRNSIRLAAYAALKNQGYAPPGLENVIVAGLEDQNIGIYRAALSLARDHGRGRTLEVLERLADNEEDDAAREPLEEVIDIIDDRL